MTTITCSTACIVRCNDEYDEGGGGGGGGRGGGGGGGSGGGGRGGDGEEEYLLLKKDISSVEPTCRPYLPARYQLAVMSFIGFISIFTLRMDLNVAILSIADDRNSTGWNWKANMSVITPGTSWSQEKQNMALSAFYYGYFSTQILGGYLSGIYGGTRIMGLSVLATSLIALATPSAIMEGYYLLVLCRVAQGMAQGLAQPCMHTIWSKWAPRQEKAKLMAISFSGCQLGNMVATLATGYMCEATPTLKWSLVFYVFGGVGFLWSVLWLVLIYEAPQKHPRISHWELDYIERNKDNTSHKTIGRPPLCRMVANPAFLAIVAAQVANDWGCFALSTCLPSYMEHVLKYDIKENGFLSSLPFIVLLVVNPVSGYVSDWLIHNNILTTKNSRKVMNSVGLLIPSVLMVGVCFVGMDRNLTILLLTLALGFTGLTMAGYTVNHLDIAPPFAGLQYSLSNTIGTSTGFIGPAILSVLTQNNNTVSRWRIFFFLTAALFFLGGVLFLLLAQGEPQPWVLPYLPKVNSSTGSRTSAGKDSQTGGSTSGTGRSGCSGSVGNGGSGGSGGGSDGKSCSSSGSSICSSGGCTDSDSVAEVYSGNGPNAQRSLCAVENGAGGKNRYERILDDDDDDVVDGVGDDDGVNKSVRELLDVVGEGSRDWDSPASYGTINDCN